MVMMPFSSVPKYSGCSLFSVSSDSPLAMLKAALLVIENMP